MKVLHNVDSWLPLTENWIYNQIKNLPETFEARVACNSTQNMEQFGDLDVVYSLIDHCSDANYFIRRCLRKSRLCRGLGYLRRPIKIFKPDIVHSHFGPAGWSVLPEIRKKIPHVVTFYGYDVSQLPKSNPEWMKRYRELFDQVSGVLCEGEHMASCVEALGCKSDKIFVYRLGVDLDKIPYQPRTWEPGEILRVLLAGRFVEKKGFPYAFRALGLLAKECPLEITVIGDAMGDRTEKQAILQAVKAANLEENVKFMGFQPHSVLMDQACKHHIFLVPSITASSGDTEGGAPVSLIEMAASGMPIVSSRHCDIPNVVIDEETGLLADEKDVDGLYNGMKWFVNNPPKWRPMLDKGRAHAEKNFNVIIQGEVLGCLYNNFI